MNDSYVKMHWAIVTRKANAALKAIEREREQQWAEIIARRQARRERRWLRRLGILGPLSVEDAKAAEAIANYFTPDSHRDDDEWRLERLLVLAKVSNELYISNTDALLLR